MTTETRWKEAQKSEYDFWAGVAQQDHTVLRILSENCNRANLLRTHLKPRAHVALEVGSGPFGTGMIAFLAEVPVRIAMDPLRQIKLNRRTPLGNYIGEQIHSTAYLQASGEKIPIQRKTLDLVLCCNVIDHASNPGLILDEIHRVLKPGGQFFFDVDTFSILGFLKWHTWTKYRHKEEVLVKAHPQRLFESTIREQLLHRGFSVKKLTGHTPLSVWIGHARVSTFVAEKSAEK